MSPRAAWRLESLGFERAYDYAGGKSDWKAAGLPTEGEDVEAATAHSAIREIPTCGLRDRLGEVRERVREKGEDVCVVTTDDGVVLGRLRGEAWDGDPDATVEDVMEPGPTTVRADSDLADLVGRMRRAKVEQILVTDADGRLLGLLERAAGERQLG